MADSEVRQKFEAWCPIKIINVEKAPRAAALVGAYWTAWQAAYSAGMRAGEIAMKEKAAELVLTKGNELGYWAAVAAIRALPLSEAEESKKEKA